MTTCMIDDSITVMPEKNVYTKDFQILKRGRVSLCSIICNNSWYLHLFKFFKKSDSTI